MEKQPVTHIEIRTGNGYFNMACNFCGQEFETGLTCAELVSDGQNCGEVCPDCLAAGPEGMAQRMRDNAERKRGYITWLEESAVEIAGLPADDWPTVEDWKRHNERAEMQLRAPEPDYFQSVEEYMGAYEAWVDEDPNHRLWAPADALEAWEAAQERYATPDFYVPPGTLAGLCDEPPF